MRYFKNLMVTGFIIFSIFTVSNVYAADKIWDKLNLTVEQKKQLEDNKAKHKDSMKATFEKMKSCRESLKSELMKPELDMNKINGIQSQIKSLHSQMMDSRLNSILEVRGILTREQFEKFIDITGKHKFRHGR